MCDNAKTEDPRIHRRDRLGPLAGLAADAEQYADRPSMPGLRERVHKAMCHAQQEAGRFARMQELADLLDKNPDISRILDLYEEFRRNH